MNKKLATKDKSVQPMANSKQVVYILSQFPEMHETFIVREIREIVARGFAVEIVSLKRPRDRFIYPGAAALLTQTIYPGWKMRFSCFWTLLFFCLFHPGRTFSSLALLVKDNYHHPVYLVKCLLVIPRSTKIAWRALRRQDELIHAHWATVPATVAWFASQLSRTPYLLTAHAWDIYLHPGNLLRLLNDARAVVTCTSYNRKFLQSEFDGRIQTPVQVIYHGLELEQFQPQPEKKSPVFTILSVGRLVPQKGFNVLLEACRLLTVKQMDFHCVIIGGGELLPQLQSLVKQLKLENQVELTGTLPHEQVLAWMNRSHVLSAPSVIAANRDRDGIPNVILEAQALALPVIATEVSGIPEVVQNLVTGILIEPNNPVALATAIAKLSDDFDLRQALGQNGRQLVTENYNIRTTINRLEQIYHEIRQ